MGENLVLKVTISDVVDKSAFVSIWRSFYKTIDVASPVV